MADRDGPTCSIGIDLGTTNCALAYVVLAADEAVSQVLPLPQRDEPHTVVESTTLPSFLYRPTAAERLPGGGQALGLSGDWVVGRLARRMTTLAPDRVAHSAKSWLAYHGVDPAAAILPWQSVALTAAERLSPLDGAAHLLGYLRRMWDERCGGRGAAWQFDRQSITITVPASFDVAAQRATLEAARRAGFPAGTRLLEEPQAAFYRWLESAAAAGATTPGLVAGEHILVVDVGGGTSDFSLFRAGPPTAVEDPVPTIERVAVSDHILLGGDNIDLALAHALESELTRGDEELSREQWGHLVARAREAKERCLGSTADERVRVALPGRGSDLLAAARTAEVSAAAVRDLLLEGFFPLCPRTDRPERPAGGLLEWGLPFAPDCAVTRYLAEFLAGHPPVAAVLFNGGTLAAPLIRDRLLAQLAEWQAGRRPRVLANPETDLAVARGAAVHGARLARQSGRISAGAPRALYLEVAGAGRGDETTRLVAILPRGAAAEETFVIDVPGLQLAVNQVARFPLLQGAHGCDDPVGAVRTWTDGMFTRLPALEARIDHARTAGLTTVPVRLQSRMNELGLLEVTCVGRGPDAGERWVLAFNLRDPGATVPTGGAGVAAEPPLTGKQRSQAARTLRAGLKQRDRARASRLLAAWEKDLGAARTDWNVGQSRALGDLVLELGAVLRVSEPQAEAWYQLAGFLLRPGFGDPGDEARLSAVTALAQDTAELSRRVAGPALIMWRRLAAGLDAGRQTMLFDCESEALDRPRGAVPERIRLLGALERVDVARKLRVVARLLDWATTGGPGLVAPSLAALGALLSRTLFQAGPDVVVPPTAVADAFARLAERDWRDPVNAELLPLFLRAARVVDDRALDLPARVRRAIVRQLEQAGVPGPRLVPLHDFVPLTRSDRATLFGEALPVGLVLPD